jgi:uracil-DNA glycosylase
VFLRATRRAHPAFLGNILKELRADLAIPIPAHGNLLAWAQRGVLLLNTTLTVRDGQAGSHQGKGWETFTDEVIRVANSKPFVVFVLWGAQARKKKSLIDLSRHAVVESAHPSPLSAHQGFTGSRPFSQIDAALRAGGLSDIDWALD